LGVQKIDIFGSQKVLILVYDFARKDWSFLVQNAQNLGSGFGNFKTLSQSVFRPILSKQECQECLKKRSKDEQN
jgi:hypothetical protein